MSRFLRIQCNDDQEDFVVFGNATTRVKCRKCGKEVVSPKGGKAHVQGAKILEVLA